MINTLRRRFIVVTMISVFVVLFVIMGAINITNYMNVVSNAEKTISLIRENGGTFPKPEFEGGPGTAQEGEVRPEGGSEGTVMGPPPFFGRGDRSMDLEAPFNTRYFTVTLDDSGSVTASDTEHIAAVSSQQAEELAGELWKGEGKLEADQNGFEGIYRYTSYLTDDGGRSYIFLDCYRELISVHNFLAVSSGVALLGMLLVLIMVVTLSRRAVKPVAESYEKQKSFITNASHEIKTPLAIIEANVDVMEMMDGETEWTRSTRNQIRRLSSLTEKLVFLSRMDEENTRLPFKEFDLAEAVRETAGSFEGVAESRGKTLRISAPQNCRYNGNEETIRQVVSLLVDNAMKYSDEGAEILVSLTKQGNKSVIRVENTVDHIDNGNLDVLFERFYRPDESRSTETGGHGIGLSVVRAIVEAHRGRVSAEGRDGKRIIFTVML